MVDAAASRGLTFDDEALAELPSNPRGLGRLHANEKSPLSSSSTLLHSRSVIATYQIVRQEELNILAHCFRKIIT